MSEEEKREFSVKECRLLDEYIEDNPLEVLHGLLNSDRELKQKARKLAAKHLASVSWENIAGNLFNSLDLIRVEDLYDTSGKTRYGYVEPVERADETFEETLEPYVKELERCLKLKMPKETASHCMGILKGLYDFEKDAVTEFRDWIPDTPRECFDDVLERWSETVSDPKARAMMDQFIAANCPEWHVRKKNRISL